MIASFSGEHHFLSNFYFAAVRYEGLEFPTVEHAFQAAKTHDLAERKRIRDCGTPGKAKQLGRRVDLRKDWESVKVAIMEALVRDKFARAPELAAQLLATGDEELVEGNTWHDTFWGVCRGRGKNHLGRILMKVRGDLRASVDAEGERR